MSAPKPTTALQRATFGCAAAVFVAPVAGLVGWQAGGFLTGFVIWVLAAFGLAAWSAWNLWQVEPAADSALGSLAEVVPRWSFNPRSSALLVGTDVLAAGGDASALVSGGAGYAIVFGLAVLTAGLVLFSEFHDCRRPGAALVKAAVAFGLVMIPTPVAGLVGAGVSFGDRLLSAPRSDAQDGDPGSKPG